MYQGRAPLHLHQAPLDSTTIDFWRMVVQEGVVNVMMLCNMLKKDAKKCCAYFSTQIGRTMDLGDVKVSCTGIDKPMTKTSHSETESY